MLSLSDFNLYFRKKVHWTGAVDLIWEISRKSVFWRWASTSVGKNPKRHVIGNAPGLYRRFIPWCSGGSRIRAVVSLGRLRCCSFYRFRSGCLLFISAERVVHRRLSGIIWRHFMVFRNNILGFWHYSCCFCRPSVFQSPRCWFWRVPVGIWKLLSKSSLFASVLISSFRIFFTNDALIVF